MSKVLIASLGDSPIVVTAMYDLLKYRGLAVDEVVLLHPEGETIEDAYLLIDVALQGECKLRAPAPLPFEDANTQKNCLVFLQTLYQLLHRCQLQGDTVFLSLAGGRKSMAALMAWVAPFFSCIEKLYHVIDKHGKYFMSVDKLRLERTDEQRKQAMHLDIKDIENKEVVLVDIPFGPEQLISEKLHEKLLYATDEELQEMHEEDFEAFGFARNVIQSGKILDVMVTENVAEKFRAMYKDHKHTQAFEQCFEKMRKVGELRNCVYDWKGGRGRPSKPLPVNLHFFKRGHTPERPLFYTEPKDVALCLDNELGQVERVVVCELEIERGENYRSVQEITDSPRFSLTPTLSLDDLLLSVKSKKVYTSILIVPLGKAPMVVTQLYTLLSDAGSRIRRVVLVYPGATGAGEIRACAALVKRMLSEENHVSCDLVAIPELEDVDSKDACELYQAKLEETIDKTRKNHSDCQIELALSGGRKGMAALTIFTAQKKRIPYVYHTLITDQKLNDQVEDEASIEALKDTELKTSVKRDRLFLRAYDRTKFTLFQVPVFPADAGI